MRITPDVDPIVLFETWLAEAKATAGIREPTAVTVTSVSAEGQPHARVVLAKDFGPTGLTFYTNYDSRKGLDFDVNPRASALFYWDPLFRQVKIDGRVGAVDAAVSEAYWRSRPRGSQLSQFVSRQSRELGARADLVAARAAAEREFTGRDVPRPPRWGGYLLAPARIEFWVGMPDRLHDRHEYTKTDAGWTHRLLYP